MPVHCTSRIGHVAQATPAAPTLRRQLVQSQIVTGDVGGPATVNRTAPQKQPPSPGSPAGSIVS